MNLVLESLKEKLAGKFIGHELHYFAETGSTNDDAFRLGVAGAPEGTVIVAESQSAGKGRLQRVWHSPPGTNIYTSVILRPSFEAAHAPQISIATGLAVAETLNPYCGGRAELKWPNDVLIGGKKVCGILAQMKTAESGIDFVVVGIGINVNLRREQLPDEIREIATSLAIEAGCEISRSEVIIRLYENLSKWYKELLNCGFEPIRRAWLGMSPMVGKAVQVRFHQDVISGTVSGLHDDGALILQTDTEQTLYVSAGDASIIKR